MDAGAFSKSVPLSGKSVWGGEEIQKWAELMSLLYTIVCFVGMDFETGLLKLLVNLVLLITGLVREVWNAPLRLNFPLHCLLLAPYSPICSWRARVPRCPKLDHVRNRINVAVCAAVTSNRP